MDSVGLILGSSVAMMATILGAAVVFATKRVPQSILPLIIAYSAGMMALSALEMVNEAHALFGHKSALISMLTGMAVLGVLAKMLPHAHLILRRSEMPQAMRKVTLLAGAITLHNIPEGFAIASAFSDSASLGWLVALSIAVQDFPEGLIVSMPAVCYGTTTRRSFIWGAFSGVVEFAAAIAGFFFLSTLAGATPFALGFSAGAMFYVVLFELLPDVIHGDSRQKAAVAFIAGVATTYLLGAIIGM